MNRVFADFQVRAVQEDERVIEGIASTSTRDRHSDELVPRGVVYALPLPFLLDHSHRDAVGEVEHIEVSDSEVRFRARIAKIAEEGPAKTLTDNAWSMIRGGLRKKVSVGFRPLKQEAMSGGGTRFSSWELLEISAVSVASNPDARVVATRAAKGRDHVVKLNSGRGHIVRVKPQGDRVVRLHDPVSRSATLAHLAALRAAAMRRINKGGLTRREIEQEGAIALLEGKQLLAALNLPIGRGRQ